MKAKKRRGPAAAFIFGMNRRIYIVDAIVCRRPKSIGGIDVVPVSVLGCGMRRSLPMMLAIVASCGSRAISVEISDIEVTISVPKADAARVVRAISPLITREHRAPERRQNQR